jgi:2-polyprenyl-6-methoxyphenol hydroxylase-like FAD-dependent oxidoreductase
MTTPHPPSRTSGEEGGAPYDVVVVGARAAGAATALLLARAGLRVLVVDRSRYGADTLSTHALLRGGVVQLHRWGLLDEVVASGAPPIHTTSFDYGTEHVALRMKPSHGVDALYAPRRTVLDPILVDAAREAGAEVRYGVSVTGVLRDAGGRVRGVAARDRTGAAIELRGRWVVGADGLHSTVADAVGAAFERLGTGTTAFVYGYFSDLETSGYEWVFRPAACAGMIPTNDGQVCVFAGSTPARIGRGGPAVFDDVVAAASADFATRLATATRPAGFRSFGGRPGHLRRSYGPGWALVGDAGYWKDPISAHGLTDALRDAELLAWAIVDAHAGHSDDLAALRAYQGTRDDLSADLFAVTDVIAGQGWTEEEIPGLLMRLSTAAAAEVDAMAALAERPPAGRSVAA